MVLYLRRRLRSRRSMMLPVMGLTAFMAGFMKDSIISSFDYTFTSTPARPQPASAEKWQSPAMKGMQLDDDDATRRALGLQPLLDAVELPPVEKMGQHRVHAQNGLDGAGIEPPKAIAKKGKAAQVKAEQQAKADAKRAKDAVRKKLKQADPRARAAAKKEKEKAKEKDESDSDVHAEVAALKERVLERVRKKLEYGTDGRRPIRPAGIDPLPVNPLDTDGLEGTDPLVPDFAVDKNEKEGDNAWPADPDARHVYQADGLLGVNPDAPHPIYELIERSEELWRGKLERASRTLPDAVKEYRRRYGREPPVGFGAWWKYVKGHNVQLPDEYDQIHHDLEPFWGMAPRDLEALRAEYEARADSWTIGKDTPDGPLEILNTKLLPTHDDATVADFLGHAHALRKMLREVESDLGVFRAVVCPHDNPQHAVDWELKNEAIELAKKGQVLDLNHPPDGKYGWPASCAPTSPARTPPFTMDHPSPARSASQKTFIYDPMLAMDPCLHPSHFHAHGQFLNYQQGPVPARRLVPTFSNAVTAVHQDIRVAIPRNLVGAGVDGAEEDAPDDLEWEEREDERLYWRGQNTGMWHAPHHNWRGAHRVRAVQVSTAIEGNVTLLRSVSGREERVGEVVERKAARLNPALMDVAFAGDGPVSCDEEGGVCGELRGMFEWRKPQGRAEEGRYKYVLDLDGNGWSSRFRRLLSSHALVFKSTVYPEWFHDRLQPWVHYIPIQNDFSDLHDALLFFRGDESALGIGGHDELARLIAKEGKEWSRKFWRKDDVVAYMFRLFLEYARVMSEERDAMSFDMDKWIAEEKRKIERAR